MEFMDINGNIIEVQPVSNDVKIITEFTVDPNGHSRVILTTDVLFNDIVPRKTHKIQLDKIPHFESNDEFHFGINEVGMTSFGLLCFNPNKRPGDGGLWSSNCDTAFHLTNIEQAPVILNAKDCKNMACSMSIEALNKLFHR